MYTICWGGTTSVGQWERVPKLNDVFDFLDKHNLWHDEDVFIFTRDADAHTYLVEDLIGLSYSV